MAPGEGEEGAAAAAAEKETEKEPAGESMLEKAKRLVGAGKQVVEKAVEQATAEGKHLVTVTVAELEEMAERLKNEAQPSYHGKLTVEQFNVHYGEDTYTDKIAACAQAQRCGLVEGHEVQITQDSDGAYHLVLAP